MASGRLSKVKGKVVDIPTPPTIGTATAGGESVSIAFTAYSGGAGGPTRSYIAKSNPGNITATGSTSPINVTGLTAGTSYTVSVAGVNETGTGEYSSASGSAVPTEATSYESISTVTVGSGGSSSVTFSSIPGTYTHLQLRYLVRDARTNGFDSPVDLTFNGSSATAYSKHFLEGNGSNASSGAETSKTYMRLEGAGNNTQSSAFGAAITDILDYTSTSKNKTVRQLSGIDKNGSGMVRFVSGLWYATPAAITSITLTPFSSPFAEYSHFALYGIKGA